MMGYGSGWISMLFGGVLVIGIIVLIIYAIVRSVNVSGKPRSADPNDMRYESNIRALAILGERYAKGEISDEEFKQKKSEIQRLDY